jgi:hypothetical protein
MSLSTVVNVDVEMPEQMLDALSIFETTCVAKRIDVTSESDVRDFLRQKFSEEIANQFRPEYLLNSRAHATHLQ